MKKYLLVLIISVFAFGCSKDKDAKPKNDDIFGKWYVTSAEVNGTWHDSKGLCIDGMYAEFTSHKVYKSYNSCSNDNYTGTYTKSGNTITCKVGGATVVYNIIEISGDKATLDWIEDSDSMKLKVERR